MCGQLVKKDTSHQRSYSFYEKVGKYGTVPSVALGFEEVLERFDKLKLRLVPRYDTVPVPTNSVNFFHQTRSLIEQEKERAALTWWRVSPLAVSLAMMATCSTCLTPTLFSSSCRAMSAARSLSFSAFISRRFWAFEIRPPAGCFSALMPRGPRAFSSSSSLSSSLSLSPCPVSGFSLQNRTFRIC